MNSIPKTKADIYCRDYFGDFEHRDLDLKSRSMPLNRISSTHDESLCLLTKRIHIAVSLPSLCDELRQPTSSPWCFFRFSDLHRTVRLPTSEHQKKLPKRSAGDGKRSEPSEPSLHRLPAQVYLRGRRCKSDATDKHQAARTRLKNIRNQNICVRLSTCE